MGFLLTEGDRSRSWGGEDGTVAQECRDRDPLRPYPGRTGVVVTGRFEAAAESNPDETLPDQLDAGHLSYVAPELAEDAAQLIAAALWGMARKLA